MMRDIVISCVNAFGVQFASVGLRASCDLYMTEGNNDASMLLLTG